MKKLFKTLQAKYYGITVEEIKRAGIDYFRLSKKWNDLKEKEQAAIKEIRRLMMIKHCAKQNLKLIRGVGYTYFIRPF